MGAGEECGNLSVQKYAVFPKHDARLGYEISRRRSMRRYRKDNSVGHCPLEHGWWPWRPFVSHAFVTVMPWSMQGGSGVVVVYTIAERQGGWFTSRRDNRCCHLWSVRTQTVGQLAKGRCAVYIPLYTRSLSQDPEGRLVEGQWKVIGNNKGWPF